MHTLGQSSPLVSPFTCGLKCPRQCSLDQRQRKPCKEHLHPWRQAGSLQVSRAKRLVAHAQGSGQQEEQLDALKGFAKTAIFKYWIQGAVFLVVLAGIDAAYSGDWSRTGVISKEFEDSLKPLVIALGVFHIGCATVAGRSAASKNLNVVPAVLKVLAVGFLAMVEVLAADARPQSQ